ncbi:MAG: DMT family transporter [Magnetospiraceae bacterium]
MSPATHWRGTLVGAVAIGMWASLALFTALSGAVPPFQVVAMAFGVAALLAVGKWVYRRENPARHLRQPAGAWMLGVGGLFGYHFLFFFSLRHAPAVEANLINYLWPLLIVLFSALLPGERLRWWHVVGALMGLGGTILLVAAGAPPNLADGSALGYTTALGAALAWSSYSVLNRRFGTVPTDAVGGFVGVAALLALASHLIFETTAWPETPLQWFAVLMLGLGPAGGAFFFWDYGVKHGDIQLLGTWAYAAPLLSTLLLIGFGLGTFTWAVVIACLLIVGGGAMAARPRS